SEGRRFAGRAAAARARVARAREPRLRREAQGQGLLRRHAPAPRHRAGDRRRSAARDRRRADGRARSRGAPALLPPARRARDEPHRLALDAHRGRRQRPLPALRRDPRRATRGADEPELGARGARRRDLRGRARRGGARGAAALALRDAGDPVRGSEPRAALPAGGRRARGLRERRADARGRVLRAHAELAGRGPRGGDERVSARRTWTIARAELALSLQRPLFWIWAAILVITAWGMSTGSVQI